MSERPTARELTEAIQEFLGGEILPTLTDQRLRFRMLVAMNALSIVYRGELLTQVFKAGGVHLPLIHGLRAFIAWLVGVGGLFGYHALYFSALRLAPPL